MLVVRFRAVHHANAPSSAEVVSSSVSLGQLWPKSKTKKENIVNQAYNMHYVLKTIMWSEAIQLVEYVYEVWINTSDLPL